jgi:hypothetical protein
MIRDSLDSIPAFIDGVHGFKIYFVATHLVGWFLFIIIIIIIIIMKQRTAQWTKKASAESTVPVPVR